MCVCGGGGRDVSLIPIGTGVGGGGGPWRLMRFSDGVFARLRSQSVSDGLHGCQASELCALEIMSSPSPACSPSPEWALTCRQAPISIMDQRLDGGVCVDFAPVVAR